MQKPILKWVGGKTQILDKLIEHIPRTINNYHEIFLGGGSVLNAVLALKQTGQIAITGNIYAYDVNEPLIYVYKNIQSNHEQLYIELTKLIQTYNSCGNGELNRTPQTLEQALLCKENYYYWIRGLYNRLDNKTTPYGSALFIFLNKTCFRGVFRMGPNGFNVPYGHYANPEIINKDHLDAVHALIQGVVFECCDFNVSLSYIQPGDYAYLDPPYAPENSTSFVAYTENGFNMENHQQLFDWIDRLSRENKKIMLSNADVQLVRNHFDKPGYHIKPILCKRSINSKNPDAKAKEVIITNY